LVSPFPNGEYLGISEATPGVPIHLLLPCTL
jgi:hypothetical protein